MSDVMGKLSELATCLCAQIEIDGQPPVCFCGVLPGSQVALDYTGNCAEACGMAWVRLSGMYPSISIGQISQRAANCQDMWGLEVEIGIVRCASVLDDQGNPPSDAQLLADAQVQMADADTMRRAVLCCLSPKDFLLGAYTPTGPQGGVVGGTFTVYLMVE